MNDLKQLYLYVTGQAQFAPRWFYRLPEFLQPLYHRKSKSFYWLGRRYPSRVGVRVSGDMGNVADGDIAR